MTLDEFLQCPVVAPVGDDAARGGPSKALPRPTKADDAEAARAARAKFDALKSDLEAVADRQQRRLERAMNLGTHVVGRRLRTVVVDHPL